MDALLDETTGGYWQCWVFQPVMLHSKDLFMGALSVVRKRETELDNSFMIFSVQKSS
jgi:hypothetical protein